MSRLLAALALLLAFTALPAVAQDASSDYERGVAARSAGKPKIAVQLLGRWLKAHSVDADAHLQLGFALLALDRLSEAEAQFERVLALSPDYTDARDGLALIAQRRSDAQARAGFVLIESSIADVSGGQSDWREAGTTVVVPTAVRDNLEVRGTWYRRFAVEDSELAALYTRRAGEDLWLRLGGGTTPGADFRPKVSVTGGFDYRVSAGPDATILGLDASWREFPLQEVWQLSPSLTRYMAGGRFSVTARANAVATKDNPLLVGGSLRGDYHPDGRSRAYVGAGFGPDTDLGVVTDTTSLFGGGEVGLGSKLAVTGSIAQEWREGPADRTEFRLGLKIGL